MSECPAGAENESLRGVVIVETPSCAFAPLKLAFKHKPWAQLLN